MIHALMSQTIFKSGPWYTPIVLIHCYVEHKISIKLYMCILQSRIACVQTQPQPLNNLYLRETKGSTAHAFLCYWRVIFSQRLSAMYKVIQAAVSSMPSARLQVTRPVCRRCAWLRDHHTEDIGLGKGKISFWLKMLKQNFKWKFSSVLARLWLLMINQTPLTPLISSLTSLIWMSITYTWHNFGLSLSVCFRGSTRGDINRGSNVYSE